MKPSPPRGFALISTLAVLVVVSILVVAYTTTIRTERGASVNFSERERAEAIGQAMVSRLLSDHAAPLVKSGVRLKPFTLKTDGSAIPDLATESTYFAEPPIPQIFSMKPQANLSSKNSLVRISQPENSDSDAALPAFTPYDWAYSRVNVTANSDVETQEAFLPYDSTGKLITPKWVDYYGPESVNDPDPVPVGEVAFTIWDDSGKIDINMAGEDKSVNGMGPHNLGWEKLAITGLSADLLAHLDGLNRIRQRNNFSLRQINNVDLTKNRIGDDRWLFSMDELVTRNLFPPDVYKQLTTYSRDFDVRPEWNGDRTAKEANNFLRSYINNPELFKLFTNNKGGPHLVRNTFNEIILRKALQDASLPYLITDPAAGNWMQMMRLMSALRQILPAAAKKETQPLDGNRWTDADIWGIALNIAQATAPPADQNLFAHDRSKYLGEHWKDPDIRLGTRLTPYITEVAVKVKRKDASTIFVTEFFEIWNPYSVDLSATDYLGGSWTGGGDWISGSTTTRYGFHGLFPFKGPPRYGITVVQNKKSENEPSDHSPGVPNPGSEIAIANNTPFIMKTRPFLYPKDYWETKKAGGDDESITYSSSIGPFFEGGSGSTNEYTLNYYISADRFDQIGEEAWASFQIDDPRMGPFTREASYPAGTVTEQQTTRMTFPDGLTKQARIYSWKFFPTSHSLPRGNQLLPNGVPDPELAKGGGIQTTRFKSTFKHPNPINNDFYGYNENLGDTWPEGRQNFNFDRAMDTFALPGRPFSNLGELGTVFANRPWRTLSYASKLAPRDPLLPVQAKSATTLFPTALLDYYTTIGTTTALEPAARTDETFAFQSRAPSSPPAPGAELTGPRWRDRLQSKIWLFEQVGSNGEPLTAVKDNNNLRPIRGRINLNSASLETLTSLLKAPYRVVRSQGLVNRMNGNLGSIMGDIAKISPVRTPSGSPSSDLASDLEVTINDDAAKKIAKAIAGDPDNNIPSIIRPLRTMADLAKLDTYPLAKPTNLIATLHQTLPDPVVDAIIGRLAQFGTVRQQIFRVDMAARALNRNVEKQRLTNKSIKRVVTAEVRFQTRLYFDTFSRKAFVESIEYR